MYNHNLALEDLKVKSMFTLFGVSFLLAYIILPSDVCCMVIILIGAGFIAYLPALMQNCWKKNGITVSHFIPYEKSAGELIGDMKNEMRLEISELKKLKES